MSALIKAALAALLSALGGIGIWLKKSGESSGRLQAKNEQLEEELRDAKQANKIQNQPDTSWSTFIKRLQSAQSDSERKD